MIQAELDLIRRITKEHYHGGLCLDVGGSDAAFRSRPKFPYNLSGLFDKYVVTDIKASPGVDLVCDVNDLHAHIEMGSVDFLICTNMLEHVAMPWIAVFNCWMAMKVGGVAIFSVPWEYQTHADPVDYWRISQQGLQSLCMRGEHPMFEEIESGTLQEPGRITVSYFVGRANG
jgi:hypothetical protein